MSPIGPARCGFVKPPSGTAQGYALDSGYPALGGAYSFRRLRTAYTGFAVQVTRSSDSTTKNIGFLTTGEFDTTTLATFCSGTDGYISIWYDQSGNGYDLIQATAAQQYRIFHSGAVEIQNGKPAARCVDAQRGMVTNPFTAVMSTAATVSQVALINSNVSEFSPRYLSLLPTGLNDIDPQGAQMLSRVDSSGVPSSSWAISRNNTRVVTVGGNYGALQQVTSFINDTSYTLSVDGAATTATATYGAFNFTRLSIGYSGSAWLSSTDEYISECIVWFTTLTNTQRAAFASNQANYFSTAGANTGLATNYLLDTSGVPSTLGAYSLRLLRNAYAGKAIRIQRDSDNTQTDIGFVAGGGLDTNAISTFCTTANGFIAKWYDQSGNGYDLVQSTLANMFRIYDGANIETQNGKPAIRALDGQRFLASAAFTTYTGTDMSGLVVAALQSNTNVFSPRYLSVWGVGNTDATDADGACLVRRNGGNPANQQWGINRHNILSPVADGIYNVLQTVTSTIQGGTSTLSVDGTATTGSLTSEAFATTNIGIGTSGNANLSVTDMYLAEAIVWPSALSAANRGAVETNARSFFHTATPGTIGGTSGGSTGGTTGGDVDVPETGWTRVFTDDFVQGYAYTVNGVAVTSAPAQADWGLYGPGPGNEGVGTREPYNVVVTNGECQLIGQGNTCGGMSGYPHSQKYGRWSVKARVDQAVGYGPAILLWPSTGTWPSAGEIDIMESPEGTATQLHTTIHYGAANNQDAAPTITTDLSQFHVYTCIWTASFIDFYLDGVRYYHNTNPAAQPPGPMELDIQYDVGAAGHWIPAPTSTTPQPAKLHVDWVRIYQAA